LRLLRRLNCLSAARTIKLNLVHGDLSFLKTTASRRQRKRVVSSFHNFDFAPGKDFVQKKSHRRRTAIWGSARASRAVNDASSLTLSSCSTRGRVEPQPGRLRSPFQTSRRLLLREAVQRANALEFTLQRG
jgi:hypothetical protein